MELVIEFLIEVFVETFIEASDEIVKNKKISKWIRYPIIILTILLAVLLIGGSLTLGIFLLNKNIIASLICIGLGILFIIMFIHELKKGYAKRKSSN